MLVGGEGGEEVGARGEGGEVMGCAAQEDEGREREEG